MKLPSIDYLISKSKESFVRFPLTVLSSLLAVSLGIYLIEFGEDTANPLPFVNLLLTAALGVPLYFCATIFAEKYKLAGRTKAAVYVVVSVLLVFVYFSLPASDTTHNTHVPYIRYGIFNLITHLLASFVPYIKTRELNGFWNYNKTLFIRFLTSALYSAFIYIGLILALSALNILFDIKIHNELYVEIYIVVAGFFNTWFFVSGIPQNLDELEEIEDYPKGLQMFAQYVLLPLLLLYLIILYAYASKILIVWNWPKGIVSYLIACVAVLGIFTFLLIYPYGNIKENYWIKKFTNAYYYTLFPLIVILFMAIWIRVSDYGITVNRYIIVLLGVWLTVVSLYFSFRKSNIKFIPVSLAVILTLMSFGPWSMFAVSERSQVSRLQKILTESNILQEGHIDNEVVWEADSLPVFYSATKNTNEKLLSDSLHNEVISILDYLDDYHGFTGIRPWFRQDIDSVITASLDSNKNINEAQIYAKTIGIEYVHKYFNSVYYTFSANENDLVNVKGYDYILHFKTYRIREDSKEDSFSTDSLSCTLHYDFGENYRLLFLSDSETTIFDLDEMIGQLEERFGTVSESNIAQKSMTLLRESARFEMKIELYVISLRKEDKSSEVSSIEGMLFLKEK